MTDVPPEVVARGRAMFERLRGVETAAEPEPTPDSSATEPEDVPPSPTVARKAAKAA